MAKKINNILSGKKAKKKLIVGINILSSIIGDTLGPRGRNVVIDSGADYPLITNDGASIAKEIFLTSPFEDIGMNILKEASLKTNELIGDGTTTAVVLANSILKHGKKYLKKGKNINILKEELEKVLLKSSNYLNEISKKNIDSEDIKNIAYVSSGSRLNSEILKEIYEKADLNSCFIEEGEDKTSFKIYEGIFLESGYISEYFNKTGEKYIDIKKPYIMLFDGEFKDIKNILNILEKVKEENGNIVLIASSFSKEAQKSIIYNFVNNILNIYAIKMPEYLEFEKSFLMDLSLSTSSNIFRDEEDINIDLKDLKQLKNMKVSNSYTYIFKENEDEKIEIKQRKENLKRKIEKEKDKSKKERLKKRLSILESKIAVVKVGSQTSAENKNLKLKFEDALLASISAKKGGVTEGGGLAFLRLSNYLENEYLKIKDLKISKEEMKVKKDAYRIIIEALKEPFNRIIKNAGKNPKKIYKEISKNKFKLGYDAEKFEYVDMFEKGIIDPKEQEITALKTAISVSSMILTISSVIYKDLDIEM